jgi:parallel beta-helix repeat protein
MPKVKSRIIVFIIIFILVLNAPCFFLRKTLEKGEQCEKTTVGEIKISNLSDKIHIDNNWSAAKIAGICTGSGAYSDPYIIEDLTIDSGERGFGILIENSEVYFKIENCHVYDGLGYTIGGLTLSNVTNGNLINNSCSANRAPGILLISSNNITILGNTVNNNRHGIFIVNSRNNTVSGNTIINNDEIGLMIAYNHNSSISGNIINYNGEIGIQFIYSANNTVSQNIMNECGLNIIGSLAPNFIDTTNLVNGKPLYYYYDKNNLRPENFTNAGQLILVKCQKSLISNLNISQSSYAITLELCNNVTISANTIINNRYGIYLGENCDNNNISGNIAEFNGYGIYLDEGSDNNILSGNSANKNDYGIILWDNSLNRILRNIVNDNAYTGIRFVGSSLNTVWENIANNNGKAGISFDQYHSMQKGCNKNNISRNIAQYNWEGLTLGENCDDNDVLGNFVMYNEYNGIRLANSDDNIISGNNASYNSLHGIYLDGSSYNLVIENNVSHNGNAGIVLRRYYSSDLIQGSDHNRISNNILIGNIQCIRIDTHSVDNNLENNTCRNRLPSIPGYLIPLLVALLFFTFLSLLCIIFFIIIRKRDISSQR